jgi:hypothetical protein
MTEVDGGEIYHAGCRDPKVRAAKNKKKRP